MILLQKLPVHSQVYVNAKLLNLEKGPERQVVRFVLHKRGRKTKGNEMEWKTWQQENVTIKKQSNLTQDELINVGKMQVQLAPQNKKMRFQLASREIFCLSPPTLTHR